MRRGQGYGDTQGHGGLEATLKFGNEGGGVGAVGGGFDGEFQLGKGIFITDFSAVFSDAAAGPNQFFDGGRIYVYAADDHHVVGTAKDAAFEGEFGTATGANRQVGALDKVASAVAKNRGADAVEGSEDEFTRLARQNGLAGGWINDFGIVCGFDDV